MAEDNGLDDLEAAVEAVVMGFKVNTSLVRLVIEGQELGVGPHFSNIEELCEASEQLVKNPRLQVELCKKIHIAKGGSCSVQTQTAGANNKPPQPKAESSTAKPEQSRKKRIKELKDINRRLKQQKLCRACIKVPLSQSGVTFLPCGHFITCESCSEEHDNCLACGRKIVGTVRTFLS